MEASETGEQVKKDIQEKYNVIGKGILSSYQGSSPQDAGRRTEIVNRAAQYWMEHKIRTAFALGRFSKADRLLEVGCTAGHYTLTLAREGYQVTGVDISDVQVERARQLVPGADFIRADVTELGQLAEDDNQAVPWYGVEQPNAQWR